MKRIVTLLLICISFFVSYSQGRKYLPLVREGVEWGYVCQYEHRYCDNPHTDYHYYRFQFRGTTMIDDKEYYKLYYYQTDTLNVDETPCQVVMREEDKSIKTLIVDPDFDWRNWNILGLYFYFYSDDSSIAQAEYKYDEDLDIWDISIFDEIWNYHLTCTHEKDVEFNGYSYSTYHFEGPADYVNYLFIEGIGLVSINPYCELGILPFPCLSYAAAGHIPTHLMLYVRDLEGNMLYQSPWFDEFKDGDPTLNDSDGVEAVEAEVDERCEYYNLQGVRMDADHLPTGLYIRRTPTAATKVVIR